MRLRLGAVANLTRTPRSTPCGDVTLTRREATMRPPSFAETFADTCSIVFLSSRNDAYRMHGAAAYYALNGLECSKKSPSAITPPTVTRSPRLNACHRLSNGREVSYSVKGCSNGIKKGGQMGGVSLPTPLHICATLFQPRARTVSACMTAVSSLLAPILCPVNTSHS